MNYIFKINGVIVSKAVFNASAVLNQRAGVNQIVLGDTVIVNMKTRNLPAVIATVIEPKKPVKP